MNKHSKPYEEKKAELEEMEKELRSVIESESEDFEVRLVRILKIAAVVSSGFLLGYGVYRWVSKRNAETSEKEESKNKKESGFIDKIVDKVTDVVAGMAIQNISKYIDNLRSDLEKEIKR
jgi:uncharacterized protein with ATP-grasp and redox domains